MATKRNWIEEEEMRQSINRPDQKDRVPVRDVSTSKSSTVKNHSGEVVGAKPDPNLVDPWRTGNAKNK